ncbi:hypothetical protein BURC_02674 [Burkholderiaceae bacterium]|nr:hypothetical protein BURC_02674 [Burkholderiaceae bacterium]
MHIDASRPHTLFRRVTPTASHSPFGLCLSKSLLGAAFAATMAVPAHAADPAPGLHSARSRGVKAPFDIVHTHIATEGRTALFQIAVSGKAGASRPAASGKLAGSTVFSYVWPTTMDPGVVGFEPKGGILAFAVTAHPDFDDTPLFDENGDGDSGNDGGVWHSHWVVLQPDEACGKDALKVVDIPEGSKPRLPKTWPGLPLLIDSPGWSPAFNGRRLQVRVPFDDIGVVNAAGFDGVTAALRVNASMHSPLLCVANVFKVASGNLSLPGKVEAQRSSANN